MDTIEAANTLANFKRYISGGGIVDRKASEAINMAIRALKSIDSDTISRQLVIELIQGSICDLEYSDENRELCNKVRALPPSPSRPQWIPCSERMPEKDGDYLTTLTDKDGNYVDVTEWQNIIGGRWIAPLDECDYCEIGNVIAWMPLPEPYQGN